MGCSVKVATWLFWGFNSTISIAFGAVALTTFVNIQQGSKTLTSDSFDQTRTFRNGLLASCMLGFLITLFFVIYSFFVLVMKKFKDMKLAYGIMLGCCSHTAWFMLLAGLVLQNASDFLHWFVTWEAWSKGDYTMYQATYGLAYLLVGTYLIAFVILLLARDHVGRTSEHVSQLGFTSSGTPMAVFAAPNTAPKWDRGQSPV